MSQNVSLSNLLIATWDDVGYYYNNGDKVLFIDTYAHTYIVVKCPRTFILYFCMVNIISHALYM